MYLAAFDQVFVQLLQKLVHLLVHRKHKKNPPDNRRVLCFKNKSRSDLLCDLSCLTLSSTEVVELSSSNLTLTDNIDMIDLG